MEMSNVICLIGNHELMAMECLKILMQGVTEESVKKLDKETMENFIAWIKRNGGQRTMDEFRALTGEEFYVSKEEL